MINRIKKIAFLSLFLMALFTPAFSVKTVYAQEDVLNGTCSQSGASRTDFCKNVNQGKSDALDITKNDSILMVVAQTLVFLTAAISVIMVVIGGFRYVVSGGDANAVKGAKDTILYALIGLVVTVFAQIIVSYVLTRFL